jgi:hypothetical protein
MRAYNAAWEKSIRDEMTDGELINAYFPGYQGGMLERMQLGVYLLRKHHFHYYGPLPSAIPRPSRIWDHGLEQLLRK